MACREDLPCRKVLLIEPDPGIQSALKDGLDDEGMLFCAAPSVRAARELLDQGCVPKVVVLDFSPPQHDSAEVLALLRTDARLQGVPVVVTTTLPAHLLPVEGDVVVRKPFKLEDFLVAIRSLAERGDVEEEPRPWPSPTGDRAHH